ncbi:MAG: methyltransferase domain-containing protein [Arenicellales bacterium]
MSAANQYHLHGSAPEKYEANMVPALFEPFARGMLEFAGLREGERVVDVACGTGIVSRLAWPEIAPSGRLVSLDLNAGMLEIARKALEERAGSIEYEEGDAVSMPFSDDEFDVAICHHGLQYFPDRSAALKEMHRVLRDAGRLVVSVWRPVEHNPGHSVLADVLDRRVGEKAGATRRAPFRLSDREEIRDLVEGAGFTDVAVQLDARVARFPSAEAMIRIMMAGTPLAAAMQDADPGALETVVDEVTEALSVYEDDLGLALPMQAWIVTATA